MPSGWHEIHEALQHNLALRQDLATRYIAARTELDAIGRSADELWERLDDLFRQAIALPKSTGDLIRLRRVIHGWSQTQLAQKLNVDQATLSRWERDQTLPRHEHQIRLADLLGGDRTDYGQPLDHHGGE